MALEIIIINTPLHETSHPFTTILNPLNPARSMNKVFIYGGGYAYDGQATLGEKQDKALPQKLDKLSKEIIPEVGITNQARLGCKGRKSSWNGWQEHIRVSRQSGLITKMATMSTSAFIQGNEPDTQGISVKKGSRFINPGFQPVRTPKTRSIG